MNLNYFLRLIFMFSIDFHLIILTMNDERSSISFCMPYHMVVDAKEKIQSETKNSFEDKNLNTFPAIEFFSSIDLRMIINPVQETRTYFPHCKHYDMVGDAKQTSSLADKYFNRKQLYETEFSVSDLMCCHALTST